MKTGIYILVLMLFFCPVLSFAAQNPSDNTKELLAPIPSDGLNRRYEQFYAKAEAAMNQRHYKEADFWLARYVGEIALDSRREKNIEDLYPLFKKHPASHPTSTMPGQYHPDFVRWFVFGSYAMWGVSEDLVDAENFKFEIGRATSGKFFAQVWASPYLEGWLMLQKKKIATSLLVLGSSKTTPYLVTGCLNESNEAEQTFKELPLDIKGYALQYLWPLEFYDLDNDGVPEVWVRYNYTSPTGFTQELAIYKIKEEGPVLFKKFTGREQGIARHLKGNTIEVAAGIPPKNGDAEQEHFETWVYRDGEFKKITEWNVPQVISTDAWRPYYLDD